MNDFSLWLNLLELKSIWKECVNALNESNAELNSELSYWNGAFDDLFQTSGVKWVNLALSASTHSPMDRDSEAYATVMGEVLTDIYMCFSTGKNPMTRKVERGIDDQTMNQCPASREEFLTVMQPDKTVNDKMRLFTVSVGRRIRNRSEASSIRNKMFRGSGKGIEYDDYIKKSSDPTLVKRNQTDSGTIVGSGRVLDIDDPGRTLGDGGTTFMNTIKDNIRAMSGQRANDRKGEHALRLLDMFAGNEIDSLGLKDIQDNLGLPSGSAARVLELLRKAVEKAQEDLGILGGAKFNWVKKPGAGKRKAV